MEKGYTTFITYIYDTTYSFIPFYATCHFHHPPSDTFLSCLYKTYLFIVEKIFILLKRKEKKHESMENLGGGKRRKKNCLMKF